MDTRNTGTSSEDSRAERRMPYGTLAFFAALVSLLTCYTPIIASTFFGISGVGFNPHVQAVVMWSFGVLALLALAGDRVRHGRVYPLAVAGTGVAVLIASLYLHYDERIEILAYLLLFVGALLNQRATIGALNDDLRRKSRQIAEFNRTLEQEVERQIGEIERLNRLKGFLPDSVAEIVVADGSLRRLQSHRQYIACIVCDIRGFTAFAEGAEPEETMDLLGDYHARLGTLIAQHGGTIGSRAGDGIMVIFNDPVPCESPVLDAVRLALAIRDEWGRVGERWQRLGHPIGLGIGITSGYATMGLLGDRASTDYTAVGGTVNLAARLCAEAADGEILADRRTVVEVEDEVDAVQCEPRMLKGYAAPVGCFRITGLRQQPGHVPAGSGGPRPEASRAAPVGLSNRG